jgi:hypothetical protein
MSGTQTKHRDASGLKQKYAASDCWLAKTHHNQTIITFSNKTPWAENVGSNATFWPQPTTVPPITAVVGFKPKFSNSRENETRQVRKRVESSRKISWHNLRRRLSCRRPEESFDGWAWRRLSW